MDGQTKHLFSNRNLFILIFPLVIEQLLAVAVGMSDTIMVATVGESAVSAVSLVDTVSILLINIFGALATGGAVVVGQYLGQKNFEKANRSGEQLLVLVTEISLLIMIILYLGRGFIINVLFGSIEEDVARYSMIYMNIVFASIPFLAIYNAGAALFRSMGNSKITMITSIIMNIINVIGNAICIYGLNMEIAGAAYPTLISRIFAAIFIIILLTNKKLLIHIRRPFHFKLDNYLVRNILHIGIPNGVENSMFQLGKIVLLSIVAGFGTASITANAISNTVSSFSVLPGAATSLGLVTVVSRCVGAGDYEQARYYTRKLLKYTYVSLFFINITIILSLPFIIDIYKLSSETAAMTRQVLIFYCINACISWATSFILPNTLRAANDVQYTMIVGVVSMWLVRVGFGIILALVLNLGMFGVWVAMIIDWIVRSFLFIIRYKGNKWQRIRIS